MFVCNLCNEGCGELVYRMTLRWVDAVHLAVFNLTLHDIKTYFDYDAAITHWINNNWELLQAPLEVITNFLCNAATVGALGGQLPS